MSLCHSRSPVNHTEPIDFTSEHQKFINSNQLMSSDVVYINSLYSVYTVLLSLLSVLISISLTTVFS